MNQYHDISVQSHLTALEMRAVKWTMLLATGRNFMVYPRPKGPPRT